MKEKVIICDIDGCVLDTSWIENKMSDIQLLEEKFEYFNKHIGDKEPQAITKICNLLRMFDNKAKVFFVTARVESLRKLTWEQLTKATGMFPDAIFMRPETDKKPPHISKENILHGITAGFDVILAIDDNPATCLMYERHGIPAICCNFQELMKFDKPKEVELT